MSKLENRAVIINKGDLKDLEFMLWLYDLRIVCQAEMKGSDKLTIVMFRSSEETYRKLYEKMDSLGIWKGELINPRNEIDGIHADDINLVDDYAIFHRVLIGVL